jgi:hypothetical protein
LVSGGRVGVRVGAGRVAVGERVAVGGTPVSVGALTVLVGTGVGWAGKIAQAEISRTKTSRSGKTTFFEYIESFLPGVRLSIIIIFCR